ncbi:MAG: LysR family transcriptional regulator, partial [Peptococcaceae bacterium]|nr:LysR family transcriptional regulator [Peptococcaceae bacterium]
MRFEDLNCLVAVADTGSITAAAKRVFISQQAVSANIKKLEDELQCTLLVREKDGVSLTSKGQETVVFARKMLEEKEEFC